MSLENILLKEYNILFFFILINMKIISHRGNNLEKVENNISGILNTLSYDYIDGTEIDVRITKDNKLVLCHDLIIKTINGDYKILQKERLSDLQKEIFIKGDIKYKIEKLDKLLKKIKNNKLIIIDCKLEFGNEYNFAKLLLNIVKKYKKINILLCTFNYKLACILKVKYKKVGLLIGYKVNSNKKKSFEYLLVNKSYDKNIINNYFVWTVNSVVKFDKINKNEKFLGIITDKGYLFEKP